MKFRKAFLFFALLGFVFLLTSVTAEKTWNFNKNYGGKYRSKKYLIK